jgi:preprotein translocase subunit SecD
MKKHFFWLMLACFGCGNTAVRSAACPSIEMTSAAASTPLMTTADITGAQASQDGSRWVLNLDMTEEASKRVQEFSNGHVGDTVTLLLDGKVRATPRIAGPITGKGFKIDAFDQKTAESLAAVMRDGCRR